MLSLRSGIVVSGTKSIYVTDVLYSEPTFQIHVIKIKQAK